MILADATRVQQIFWNLLTNAIKFTPAGGTISIKLKIADAHPEKLAQVEVCDSGIGIKGQFLPRIFERFSQEDSSMTRRHGGLGLGLTLVKTNPSGSTPDVLLSDISMPGEDGYSLIGKLRALPAERGGKIPAVALTAYAGAEDVRRVMAAGFSAHVAKPVDRAALFQTIVHLVKQAKNQ